jgi:MFS family permease
MINGWAVAFLVMYFGWLSDHTLSRLGRRVPYILISGPFLAASIILVPYCPHYASLIILWLVGALFRDMMASTSPLLGIDCVPRPSLGRFGALSVVAGGIVSFAYMQWGMGLNRFGETIPFWIVGGFILGASALSLLVVEPPIRTPATERFKPWSALRIGIADRRMVVLMLGVSLIYSFQMITVYFLYFYVKDRIGMDAVQMQQTLSFVPLIGLALAWPVGWAIDRIGSIPVIVTYWFLNLAACVFLCVSPTVWSLIVASILMAVATPLYTGADIMVYRNTPGKDMGSVTSSNSFIRNMYIGSLSGISGLLISQWQGDQRVAFIFAMVMTTVGLGLFFLHRRMSATQAR